jgi:regulator of protease activity HflC (stomatin/prohibitin superfamily)
MAQIPKWGRIEVQPHEFVIVMQGGRVTTSGQGLAVFKWPWESVAVVPTSIKKLSFRADQVTLEKTGVEVTGLAVYRVVDPLLAFRMLDGDMAGLTDILRDMFVGATRRIVAGLTLAECITSRKERVAAALLAEIAPVLAGEGRADDVTSQGWGVVLDTLEIQDVRVLSEDVFARLQAPYREALHLEALRAHDQVVREEEKLRAEAAEHAQRRADSAQEAELARHHRRAEAERERASIDLAARRAQGELEAELARMQRNAHGDLSEARLQEILLTETLPNVAQAFRGSFDHVTVTSGDSFGFLSAGVEQVMNQLARARKQ